MSRRRLRPLFMSATASVMMLMAGRGWAQGTVRHTPMQHLPTLVDLPQLREFSQLAVSPDGRWVAYVMSAPFRMSDDKERQRTLEANGVAQITLLDLQENRTVEVTVSGYPQELQWSPTGATLTFLAASHGRNRLWLYSPIEAGQPQPIAISDSLRGSIVAFAWSSAGDTIAYLASELTTPGHVARLADTPPRLVLFHDTPGEYTEPTVPAYAKDTVGAYVAIAAPGGAQRARVLVRRIVSSEVRPELDWSPSGPLLISGSPMGVGYWNKIAQRVLYTLDPRTGDLHQVLPPSKARAVPSWSPSGRWIAYLKADFIPDSGPAFSHVLQVENPTQPGTERTLSPESDGLTASFRPLWGADDSTLYIARYRNGTARMFAVDVASGRWRALTPDTLSVSRYAFSHDRSMLVAVLENANQPAELFRIDIASGQITRLTHEASTLLSVRLGHVDQVTWRSSDDRFTVHGFLVKPPDYDSTRRYPLIVQIRGGPGGF